LYRVAPYSACLVVLLPACALRSRPPATSVCDATHCVSLARMEASVRAQLNGKAVGYAYVLGGATPVAGSGGFARTAADGAPIPFTSQTRITVASLSKWITAIATMAVLRARGVGLDDAIGPYFPSDWQVPVYLRALTFSQLLSHTSGIKDFGNGPQLYDRLQQFFTRPVNPSSTTACTGARVTDPPDAVTPQDRSRCYSNYNFAILRLLLSRVAGFAEGPNPGTRPATLANEYEALVQEHVFRPVGVAGPACHPTSSRYAFAYFHPGDKPGHDWGDVRLRCGDAGWYVSVEDMARVLHSVNSRDGRILAESREYSALHEMRARGLGVDINTPELMEKGGLWGDERGLISTSGAIFGPASGPNLVAVLFINSDVVDGPPGRARGVLQKAYQDAMMPRDAARD
jgi:CubicO group peptidase (beta-lactamase class C family)